MTVVIVVVSGIAGFAWALRVTLHLVPGLRHLVALVNDSD